MYTSQFGDAMRMAIVTAVCFCSILSFHGVEAGRYSNAGEISKLIVPLIIVFIIFVCMLALLAFFYIRKNRHHTCICNPCYCHENCCKRSPETVAPPVENQYKYFPAGRTSPSRDSQLYLSPTQLEAPPGDYRTRESFSEECHCQAMLARIEAEQREQERLTKCDCPCTKHPGFEVKDNTRSTAIPPLLPPPVR